MPWLTHLHWIRLNDWGVIFDIFAQHRHKKSIQIHTPRWAVCELFSSVAKCRYLWFNPKIKVIGVCFDFHLNMFSNTGFLKVSYTLIECIQKPPLMSSFTHRKQCISWLVKYPRYEWAQFVAGEGASFKGFPQGLSVLCAYHPRRCMNTKKPYFWFKISSHLVGLEQKLNKQFSIFSETTLFFLCFQV